MNDETITITITIGSSNANPGINVKSKKYVSKYVKMHVKCVETECMAGICGIAVTPDLNYWDCPRHQEIIEKYPRPIKEVLRRP